jgi:diadenylate cyclase
LKTLLSLAVNYISDMGVNDVLDILLVAFLIYKLTGLIRRTSSSKVAKGGVVLLLATWLSGELRLNVVNYILRNTVAMGLLALVILFQPELRRILEKVGASRFSSFFNAEAHMLTMDTAITQTVLACCRAVTLQNGALVIFERDNRRRNQVRTAP